MNNLDLEKLYKVTREEFGENVDAVLEKVKETSPILIRSEGEPDLLLLIMNIIWNCLVSFILKNRLQKSKRVVLTARRVMNDLFYK